jgi:hypothetical protein
MNNFNIILVTNTNLTKPFIKAQVRNYYVRENSEELKRFALYNTSY